MGGGISEFRRWVQGNLEALGLRVFVVVVVGVGLGSFCRALLGLQELRSLLGYGLRFSGVHLRRLLVGLGIKAYAVMP